MVTKAITKEEIERTISEAIQKIRGKKEREICKYLPAPQGEGHIHHFTLNRMKKREPSQLQALLKEFILDTADPRPLKPKRRAPRGSRKVKGNMTFNHMELGPLIDLARKAGYHDIVAKLTPKYSLAQLKRQMIRMVKEERVDQELWHLYSEALSVAKE